MIALKKQLGEILEKAVAASFDGAAITADELVTMLEYPPDKTMGDLALPCFRLSKSLRRAPVMIAAELAGAVSCEEFSSVSAVSGYLNFKISPKAFARRVVSDIERLGEKYGSSGEGAGKTVVLDYSSPNISKPFHIGHLGTTVIGHSLKMLHEYAGYDCIGINHLGDWGTQFGKLITPLLSVLSVYAPVAIIEVATYAPMMGAGGSYIGFITGNISSLKLPCALATLDANNVDISTDEGEVLSLLAISVSALVTTLVVALGVLLLATTSIGEFLKSPVLGPAFDNLLAALFGALGVVYVSKNFKIALPPLLLMILLFIVAPSLSVGVLIPIGAVFAVACARVMYKKGML